MIETEENGFARETSSNALINTNKSALEQYKAAKRNANKTQELEKEISELRDDISEIKELLRQLVK